MESVERTFQLHVPSSTENLAMIREFVGRVGERAGMGPAEVTRLELAVDEACANVIEHAYGSDDTREVTVKATVDAETMAIEIVDTGRGFDPAQVEQVNGTRSFIIRLAHMVGGTLRRPEEVAGALAEELLSLYRDAAAVTIVRQTPAAIPATILVAAERVAARKDGRSGVVPQPRAAAKEESEGNVVAFRPNPLGTSTNGHAS